MGIEYKALAEGDIIQEGDEWYNFQWFMETNDKSPWYTVETNHKGIGTEYRKEFRLMRRPISEAA